MESTQYLDVAVMTNEQLVQNLREWAFVVDVVDPRATKVFLEVAQRLESINPPTVVYADVKGFQLHCREVARTCVKQAKAKWGKGWDLLSPASQRDAVASEIVRILLAQTQQHPETLQYLTAVAAYAFNVME